MKTRTIWQAFMKSADMFKINRDNQSQDFHGRDQTLNDDFESAKTRFDNQTHESMTRKHLSTEDVKKMVDPKVVIMACLLISGVKKTVDRLVR